MGLQIFIHMLPAVLAGRAAHISLEDLAIIGRRGESGHAGCFCNAFPVFQKQKAVLDPENKTYSKMVIFIYFLKNLQHSLLQILTWLATSSRVISWA